MKVKTKMTSVSVLVLLVWIATASSACLAQETRVVDKFSTECKTLGGTGSLNSECVVSKSHQWKASDVVTVIGPGNITVEENVTLSLDGSDGAFEQEGQLNISIGGRLTLMPGASLRAPTIVLAAKWLNLYTRSSVNASGLGSSTLGRPVLEEYGAGYGGTGSACDKTVGKGGSYGWKYDFSGVAAPFSQLGGGSSSAGSGGGRILINVSGNLTLAGAIESNGLGSYRNPGGGGSGGSVTINSVRIINNSSDYSAVISASGGPGTTLIAGTKNKPGGGGGGGRISVTCEQFDSSIQLEAAGGRSSDNCTSGGNINNGAAGTIYLSENDVAQLHISNNGQGVDRLTTSEVTYLGLFPQHNTLDKFILQYDAVAEMLMDLPSTVIIAREVELTSSSALLFGDRSGKWKGRKKKGYGFQESLSITADSFAMANSVMDVHAGYLLYGGLYTSAGSFNLSDSSVVTIVAQSSSASTAVSKILGSVSITSGSSLISDGKLYLSPIFKTDSILEIGSGNEIEDLQNIVAGSYITFMGYKNVSIAQNSQVIAPCTPNVAKACSNIDPCSTYGAFCPTPDKPENPCLENTRGFWTISFCRISDTLRIAGGRLAGSNVFVADTPRVSIENSGQMLADYGCPSGAGPGNGTGNSINGAGGGAGHGGNGGNGSFDGQSAAGGMSYGRKGWPCENGSGGGSGEQPGGRGGGTILMGSKTKPVNEIYLDGKISANGQNAVSSSTSSSGGGGGSGGSILIYANSFSSDQGSRISADGGNATFSGGGGGGAGGRIHFEWIVHENHQYKDNSPPLISCNVTAGGGVGSKNGSSGGSGTETTISCPKGRTGIFCAYCPLGFYKDTLGSDQPCKPCQRIPRRANYTVAFGGTSYPCSYGCYSSNLRTDCALPNELFDIIVKFFGGTWEFIAIFWNFILIAAILSGSIKSVLAKSRKTSKRPRMKWQTPFFTPDKLSATAPLLESLDEVLTNEEASARENYEDFTVRIHFEGTGSVHDPWKLHHVPPPEVKKGMVIESEYIKFVDSCNRITMSESLDLLGAFGIMKLLCPPIAWKWKNKHRKLVLANLQDFIESEEGHSFLRSARSRALLDVLRFGHSQDLTLAYFDLHISAHELQSSRRNARQVKRSNEELLQQHLPLLIMFAGEGSFLSPYNVQLPTSDFVQQFLCEIVSPLIWVKLVRRLNMQLQNTLRSTLEDDVSQLQSFIDRKFATYLSNFEMKASLYVSNLHMDTCQIGLLIESLNSDGGPATSAAISDIEEYRFPNSGYHPIGEQKISQRKLRVIATLKKLLFCAHASFSGPRVQATLGLVIFLLVTLDGCVTIYLLIELFALKGIFIVALLVPPLSILASPFNGLFQLFHQSRKDMASALRLHNIWNMCSMISVLGVFFGELLRTSLSYNFYHIPWYHSQSTFFFLVPLALLLEKICQILLVNIFAACMAEHG